MNQFVLIFSIVLKNPNVLEQVVKVMSRYDEIIEWSCDVNDVDNVVRVVCYRNISEDLNLDLDGIGVSPSVLAVYRKTKAGGKLMP